MEALLGSSPKGETGNKKGLTRERQTLAIKMVAFKNTYVYCTTISQQNKRGGLCMPMLPKPPPRERKKRTGMRRNAPLCAKKPMKRGTNGQKPKAKQKRPEKREKNPLKLVNHKPKQSIPADFPPAVRKRIRKRDGDQCVYRENGQRCAQQVAGIHHVIFKSQGGLGTEDNGVCVCQHHHDWAHGLVKLKQNEPGDAGRRWMEHYINELYGK